MADAVPSLDPGAVKSLQSLDISKYKEEQRVVVKTDLEQTQSEIERLKKEIEVNAGESVSLNEQLEKQKLRMQRMARVFQAIEAVPE